jgi:RNA-directed DNA polymerase
MTPSKPFAISKRMVWEAYKAVKANKGAPGVDGQTIESFERNLARNLYCIWNRLASGSYFPPPVLQVEIPKRDGGVRELGIPTVGDRVAQAVVAMHLGPITERRFHPDSYGYRPGRSAHEAVEQARQRCWHCAWALDLDIRSFFDSLDHLAFDQWMLDCFADVPFERYADDIVVHCRSREEAEGMRRGIAERLQRCRLQLHPEKTRIVCCRPDVKMAEAKSFDFLGFTFQPRSAKSRAGKFFVTFSPTISGKAAKSLRATMRRKWRMPNRTEMSLDELAKKVNPVLRGWVRYYGRFRPSALVPVFRGINLALRLWVMRKYKRFKRRPRAAMAWLRGIAAKDRGLFAHWRMTGLAPSVAAGR